MESPQSSMYAEIDIRPYIEHLIKQRIWIALALIGPTIIAYIFLGFRSPQYSATSLVAITNPRFSIAELGDSTNAGNRFEAYEAIAQSDEILESLFNQIDPTLLPDSVESHHNLGRFISVNNQSDASVIEFSVMSDSPEFSSQAANIWATVFIERANFIFDNEGNLAVDIFTEQLTDAEAQLQETNERLVEFEGNNRVRIIENRLADLLVKHLAYLNQRDRAEALKIEVDALAGKEISGSNNLITMNQILSIYREISTLDNRVNGVLILEEPGSEVRNSESVFAPFQEQSAPQIELQLAADDLTTADLEQEIAFLRDLIDLKTETLADLIEQAELDILMLQSELHALSTEESRLRLDFELASTSYSSLRTLVEEAKISSDESFSQVQLASRASVPVSPEGDSRASTSILIGIIGMLSFAVLSLALFWWQESAKS